MMAGWSSANNFALLGGQRAAALMISAEIAIGASIMGVVMIYGSLNMQDIVRGQGDYLLWGWLPKWGIVTQLPDRKSTRLNSSHGYISYAVFCLKKKNTLLMTVLQTSS